MKKSKKYLSLLLATAVTTSITFSSTSLAQNIDTYNLKQIQQTIKEVNEYFDENNTNVINELENGKVKLLNELQNAEDSLTRSKIESQINTYNLLISNCKNYDNISTYIPEPNTLTIAVAAIVSYFDSNGYDLAAELLAFAYQNKSSSVTYQPYNGYKASASNITNKIRFNNKDYGSEAFPNSGNKNDKDLYYAIHAFDYTKFNGRLIIRDTYDYAVSDYTGIAGAAVNTMWLAQQLGVIVPFNVEIYLPL